jgi:hypothetical protein
MRDRGEMIRKFGRRKKERDALSLSGFITSSLMRRERPVKRWKA